jgi:hypothetical protein
MKIVLKSLQLKFRRSTETLHFEHVNFFYGKIGAGKSSIVRLIDYCLGANISFTPALQLEFVQATLSLEVAGRPLAIYREKDSRNVIAAWADGGENLEVLIPAREADGIVVPGTSIEVLSDLIFHLAGLPPPLVRKGRKNGEKGLVRLSFRDLYRYCYIDQDEIDSDFFRLDLGDDWVRRAKSVDAMRFILGYHQDRVASLEAELQDLHDQKLASKAAAEALNKVLEDAGFESPAQIEVRIEELSAQRDRVRTRSTEARQNREGGSHAVDLLREEGRTLSLQLREYEEQFQTIQQRIEETTRHLNELKMLSVRFGRTKAARTLLAGVDFLDCPRCTQTLPVRDLHTCPVCGQPEGADSHEHMSDEVLKGDLRARLFEIQETLTGLTRQEKRHYRELDRLRSKKAFVDHGLTERLREYDSAFMSQAIDFERQATTLEQQINALLSFKKLPELLAEHFSAVDKLQGQESELRATLTRERKAAFKDLTNLEDLQSLFLDCLVRSDFPGVNRSFIVTIDRKSFVPEVTPSGDGDIAVTSFANMGSGGMKSIFKACFALALHRQAAKSGAALPSLLVIDSAMKNVSERENQELYEAFYTLVYELAAGELKDTQIILVDKEMFPAPEGLEVQVKERNMAPGSKEHPPLIPYYLVPAEVIVADDESNVAGDFENGGDLV